MRGKSAMVGLTGLALVLIAGMGIVLLYNSCQRVRDGYTEGRGMAQAADESGNLPGAFGGELADTPAIVPGNQQPGDNPADGQSGNPGTATGPGNTNLGQSGKPTQPGDTDRPTQPGDADAGAKQAQPPVKEVFPDITDEQKRQQWIEAKLEEYKDEIDEADVEDFRRIIGKLDMSHAISLLDNPDLAAGEAELKAYLHSVLTDSEYQRTKQLFAKYNHILFD
jgi:hypothetical protein